MSGELEVRRPQPTPVVMVETGRGNAVAVPVGSNAASAINRIAEEANYGGFFRVFRNGGEMLNEPDPGMSIQEGDRWAITSYDKVG